MKTRKEYMSGVISHADYYAQFVTDPTLIGVYHVIGIKRLLASTDKNLNDISLHLWDRIGLDSGAYKLLKSANDSYSLATSVCINKAAARILINQNKDV